MLIDRVTTLNGSGKRVMSAALVVVAAIAIYGWVLSPHVAYLHAVQRYEPAVETVADKKDTVCKALGVKRRELRRVQSELGTLRNRFFTASEATAFFSNLELLSEETGCVITSLDFVFETGLPRATASSDLPTLVAHRANLTALGRYGDLIEFLRGLQGHRQEVQVASCRIEAFDGRSGLLKCDVAVAIWVVTNMEDSTDE